MTEDFTDQRSLSPYGNSRTQRPTSCPVTHVQGNGSDEIKHRRCMIGDDMARSTQSPCGTMGLNPSCKYKTTPSISFTLKHLMIEHMSRVVLICCDVIEIS